MLVLVKGIPKTNAYIDKEGNPRSQIEINLTVDPIILRKKDVELLNKAKETNDKKDMLGADLAVASDNPKPQPKKPEKIALEFEDDDLPF